MAWRENENRTTNELTIKQNEWMEWNGMNRYGGRESGELQNVLSEWTDFRYGMWNSGGESMCVTLAATLCVWHVLSSATEIDMDGENKLENKINIVYYVHWELEALARSRCACCACVYEWMCQKRQHTTEFLVPKCSAIYVIGIWILEFQKLQPYTTIYVLSRVYALDDGEWVCVWQKILVHNKSNFIYYIDRTNWSVHIQTLTLHRVYTYTTNVSTHRASERASATYTFICIAANL